MAPNVVFLTASAAKGEKKLHQYWQIITDIPQTICECENNGQGNCVALDNTIQVKDLSSKETYEVLMPQIRSGMPARNQYCEAVNNTFINEARSGNWARVDHNSPLMKMK